MDFFFFDSVLETEGKRRKNRVPEWEAQARLEKLEFLNLPPSLSDIVEQSQDKEVLAIIQAHPPSLKRFKRISRRHLWIYKKTLKDVAKQVAMPYLLRGKEVTTSLKKHIEKEAKQQFQEFIRQEFESLFQVAQRAKELHEFIERHKKETASRLLTTLEVSKKFCLNSTNVIRKYGWTGKVRCFQYEQKGRVCYYFCETDVDRIVKEEENRISRRRKALLTRKETLQTL